MDVQPEERQSGQNIRRQHQAILSDSKSKVQFDFLSEEVKVQNKTNTFAVGEGKRLRINEDQFLTEEERPGNQVGFRLLHDP